MTRSVARRLGCTTATFGCMLPEKLHAMTAAGFVVTEYPSKPIRILISYPSGGPLDVTPRLIVTDLSTELGRQVIVENRSGPSGQIATDAVARSSADGYTLLATASTFIVNPLLMEKVNSDPIKDFVPVSEMAGAAHGARDCAQRQDQFGARHRRAREGAAGDGDLCLRRNTGGPPEAFGRFLAKDLARWGTLIKAAGIKAE